MKSLIILLFVFVSCKGKYYAGMCGVDSCVCYGRMHYEGRLIRYDLNPEWDTTVMTCDIINVDTFVIDDSKLIVGPAEGTIDTIDISVDTPMVLKGGGNNPATGIGIQIPKLKKASSGDGILGSILFTIETDNLPITKRNGITADWTDASQATSGGLQIFPLHDTIKVILLVCDTSENSIDFFQVMRVKNPFVEWRYGHEIRVLTISNPPFIYLHDEYLDENKKPFPKSIIIWISKEIKQ